MLRPALALFLAAAVPCAALAAEEAAKGWDGFQATNSPLCVGLKESMSKPEKRTHAGHDYTFEGYRLKVRKSKPAASGEVRFGVVAGIKELDGDTRGALRGFFDRFKEAKVDYLIVGGDSGSDEAGLAKVFAWVAAFDLPTFVVAGNWEPTAAFNDALRGVSRDHPNMINMDLARRADLDGVDIVSLGGYLDRAFVKATGPCVYQADDVETIADLSSEADDPVLLLSHGPPRQEGSDAIDFVPGVGNVGDPEMAAAVTKAGIKLGIFGHINEAGARATDEKGRQLKPGRFYPALFLNPGPATTQAQKLNSGSTAHGLAAILTVKGRNASYEVLRAEKSGD